MTKGSPTSGLLPERQPPPKSTTVGKFSIQAIRKLCIKQMEAPCACGGDVRSSECVVQPALLCPFLRQFPAQKFKNWYVNIVTV